MQIQKVSIYQGFGLRNLSGIDLELFIYYLDNIYCRYIMVTDDQEIVKTILFEQILEEIYGKFIYFRNSVGFKLVHVFG